jgi:phosphopantothenoylcysteine decarboxylase/phosphopantothenate--cysteine ligase
MNIALGVTGCIAAYKAVEVLRGLQKRGASVRVVLTSNAARFVTPLTFQSISGWPVISGMFEPTEDPEIKHIAIAQSIDLLLVAPATANSLAKFANGIADDFLSTLYISTRAPVMVAPAMNAEMWLHPATGENVRRLRDRGVYFIDPEQGYLACKTVGPGRLAEPANIVEQAWEIASRGQRDELSHSEPKASKDLEGHHVLVSAGPTFEAIDPVRGLTNRSSGRMGYSIAAAAADRGAQVTLVTGPVSLNPPAGVTTIRINSAAEMHSAVLGHLPEATIIVMAAAVADYRPVTAANQKIKKSGARLTLELEKTEDILAAVCRNKAGRVAVGFAAETESVISNAQKKLQEKGADLIVANDVSKPGSGFDVETNQVTIISAGGMHQYPILSKREVAERILDSALERWTSHNPPS